MSVVYVTCGECGAEYDLNYSEDRVSDTTYYDACPDCGVVLDSVSAVLAAQESLVSEGE